MAEYMMIMKGLGPKGDWPNYIEKLVQSGKFRGGSAFGNGICIDQVDSNQQCMATGFMRFEANSIKEVQKLLVGNPTYEAGGAVEIHELVVT